LGRVERGYLHKQPFYEANSVTDYKNIRYRYRDNKRSGKGLKAGGLDFTPHSSPLPTPLAPTTACIARFTSSWYNMLLTV
jgi:hypothetical protein